MFRPQLAIRLLAVAMIVTVPLAALASPDEAENRKPGYLGIRMQRIEGGLAEALDLKEDGGVLVGQVMKNSPAEEAGLESGDILLAIDGDKVGRPDAVRDRILALEPGATVQVEYLRDGRTQRSRVTLGEAPRIERRSKRFPADARELRVNRQRGFLGVMTQPLTGQLGEYFGVEENRGVLVTEVVDESPAAKLGLEAGDVIIEVDGNEITSPSELRRVVGSFEEETDIEVAWIRDGRERNGRATLEIRERSFPRMGWHHNGLNFDFDLEPLREHMDFLVSDETQAELKETIEAMKEELRELRDELNDIRKESKAD